MLKRIFFFFVDTIQAVVFAASIFILLYLFIAQPNQVNGNSMLPNFQNKELLLTDKLTYRFRSPKRGEVVVFKAPPSEPCAEDECEYIKRLVGLAGERIMIKGQHVYINGKLLEEDYLPTSYITEPGSYLSVGKEVIIPKDGYILLGDNRSHSRDSREIGLIERQAIVGRAFFVYWPPQRIGLVKKPVFSLSL